jgi:hypothetical protein
MGLDRTGAAGLRWIACPLLALASTGCTGLQGPGRRVVIDAGYGADAGGALGAFLYRPEEVGYWGTMNLKYDGGPRGTDYTGVLPPGGFPGDERIGTSEHLLGTGLGATYQAHERLGLFAGVSMQLLTTYFEYFDPTLILDPQGEYHVRADEEVLLGLVLGTHLLLTPELALGGRYDTALGSAVVSLGFSF